MGLLGLVVLLMVVRPLVRRILAPDERAMRALPAGSGFPGGFDNGPAGLTREPSAGASTDLDSVQQIRPPDTNKTSQMIDMAQVQGQVHAQSVQKVGEIADKNPRETVSIIRQWLQESAAA
jgi:flagellar M-ring protein FliF